MVFFFKKPVQWEEMADGGFQANAFIAGSQETRKQIFVARVKHEDGLQPCQLKEGHGGAQMPYGGEGKTLSNYEVLAASGGLFWKSIAVGELPVEALKTGNEANGDALYSAKYKTEGKLYIGKYNGKDKAYFVIDHKEREIESGDIRILCYQESAPREEVSMKI